jgi:hypothetical protein
MLPRAKVLEQYGAMGWEAWHMLVVNSDGGAVILFKRPVRDEVIKLDPRRESLHDDNARKLSA